ncbi:glycosyltransferase family 4 protein [Sphingomonas montana]|uniref:glycosyltransferase family 4 protein n=1 Tax=Sphingomonas montana TaxID=1843236 RepID=UPI00096C659D|nr:glycosyltransferase family 4 protein [Sphingomonas montana]
MTGDHGRGPVRILFVFAWLVVGGEETEVRLLAAGLDRTRYRIDVVACFRKEGMPEQTHEQLRALGVDVDTVPYNLSFDETVGYLASKIPAYDIVVSCQDVADLYPALERLQLRPPLIEHGGLVSEALSGPKHFTTRYVGVCNSIRDAAATRMPGREEHALAIPSMVDPAEYDSAHRAAVRAELGIADAVPLVGWVGRLDAKKRVEDFIDAAARVHAVRPDVRFVVIGGPDVFMPDYADTLRARSHVLGLDGVLRFLGDRGDVPRLFAGLDIFAWLSRGEGMPHVIAEAGMAGLPVIATRDNGSEEQITDGRSGLFVPHESPAVVADAILRLAGDAALRRRLGDALQAHVLASYATTAVLPRWAALFDTVLAEHPKPVPDAPLFRSFFQGGFECSTHRRAHDRQRVDTIAATHHDTHAAADYRALQAHGIVTVRDGLRWHRIETRPGVYDWSSVAAQLDAATTTGTEVVWDLLHYGWPDDIDIWSPEFVTRFARFAAAAARMIRGRTTGRRFYAPVNEISFFAWGGGDVAYLNPFARGRGFELKVQLARASIAAMEAILRDDPEARFIHADPVMHYAIDPARPHDATGAEGRRQSQFQGWDLLAGRLWPQIGGRPGLLDIVGVNYYHNNQRIHGGDEIDVGHPLYKPFRAILADTYARYGRPIFVAETGIEADRRADWLRYVAAEVRAAMALGVPVEGICLYPVLNHPGWDDDRACHNGLLEQEIVGGGRAAYPPLAAALREETLLFGATQVADRAPV